MERKTRTDAPLISLLVPVFNEAAAVTPFLAAVIPVIEQTQCPFEIVFIDDGSQDGTRETLRQARTTIPQIAIIALSRNFGKEAALTAGIDYAKGDVVIPIDVDLQDPPELIAQFLEKWREGFDVVYGVRKQRTGDSLTKKITAKAFYAVFNTMSGYAIPANSGDFRLMDRRVVEEVKKLRERTRFMKGIMSWPGFSAIGVPFERPQRAAGTTSWNYRKLLNFALDGITSFSATPLRLLIYFGSLVATFSFVYALYIIVDKLIWGNDVPGYPSLIVALAFFSGLQILALGIIGEYIGRLFHEVKQRPIYIIDNIEDDAVKGTGD
jgi:glycosyltransferase involved in cell wall biosynthesis